MAQDIDFEQLEKLLVMLAKHNVSFFSQKDGYEVSIRDPKEEAVGVGSGSEAAATLSSANTSFAAESLGLPKEYLDPSLGIKIQVKP